MITSWILISIAPSLAPSIIYSEPAFTIWNDLKDRFSELNATKKKSNQADDIELEAREPLKQCLLLTFEVFMG